MKPDEIHRAFRRDDAQDTALRRHSGSKFRPARPGNRMIPEFELPLKPNGQIMNGLHFLTLEA
ncbi:hypothetical protein D4L85_21025 [Chryseolinea soli]|uniref:Uncharacterized protein n=1 Tax=Chryseolinea soli TaxID=2321403 RepID=A0A385SRW2_9BACT|nr:hypothetical protein D4L85_21025 [Chryseolinea soli]